MFSTPTSYHFKHKTVHCMWTTHGSVQCIWTTHSSVQCMWITQDLVMYVDYLRFSSTDGNQPFLLLFIQLPLRMPKFGEPHPDAGSHPEAASKPLHSNPLPLDPLVTSLNPLPFKVW